jgi:hypothetical protein
MIDLCLISCAAPRWTRHVAHVVCPASCGMAVFSPEGARFHSKGHSPGDGRAAPNESQTPTGRVPRRESLRCATWCHPVGVSKWLVRCVPRALPALPWAVEYDPLGVGDAVVPRVLRASGAYVIHAAFWPSRRVAVFSPEGARFHSEGRSPGVDRGAPSNSEPPTGRHPRRESLRCATWCRPAP